jgi:hypothetical protein
VREKTESWMDIMVDIGLWKDADKKGGGIIFNVFLP